MESQVKFRSLQNSNAAFSLTTEVVWFKTTGKQYKLFHNDHHCIDSVNQETVNNMTAVLLTYKGKQNMEGAHRWVVFNH